MKNPFGLLFYKIYGYIELMAKVPLKFKPLDEIVDLAKTKTFSTFLKSQSET